MIFIDPSSSPKQSGSSTEYEITIGEGAPIVNGAYALHASIGNPKLDTGAY